MPVSVASAGSVAYSAASGTSVAPPYPPTVANDILILFVGQKPSVANSGSVTTPAGWNPLGSLTGAGGYGTTLGADTGNTNLFAYAAFATGTESGSLTVTVGTNNVCWAQIVNVRLGGFDSLSFAGLTSGSDTVAGPVSVTVGSQAWAAGDLALWAFCAPTDVNAGAEYSAHQISETGLGFSAATAIAEAATANGNDIGGYTAYATILSGSGTVAPTFAALAAASSTNIRGPGLVVRIAATTATARGGDFLPLLG